MLEFMENPVPEKKTSIRLGESVDVCGGIATVVSIGSY